MGSASLPPTQIPIRSTKGCWTCRLRKKKCDETVPGCLRCGSVKIECHYGTKPGWILSPELGKRELERIKSIVAVATTRKRTEHRARVRLASAVSKSPSDTAESTSPGVGTSRTLGDDQTPIGIPLDKSVDNSGSSWLSAWIKDQEADLIMHYLDHVFYIQFRFYTSSISTGGRGWFLSLITRTKPLYHAALSLAAFHQQSLILGEQVDGDNGRLDELEKQHQLTLHELQLFIQAHSMTSSANPVLDHHVQILACVVQMISFELFNGGASNWRVHLKAGCDLLLMIHEDRQKLTDRPNLERRRSSNVQSAEISALSFFTGCVIWFDILSSISTRIEPNLNEHHRRLLLGSSPGVGHDIKLETICGAQNWVMSLIGEIAALSHRRTEWMKIIDLSAPSFEDSARDIELRLHSQHQKVRDELVTLRQQHGGSPLHSFPELYTQHITLVVTRIFASAAEIYLQTAITSSDISPLRVQPALQNTIDVMRMIHDHRIFRGLVWPLSVAGCMASTLEEQDCLV